MANGSPTLVSDCPYVYSQIFECAKPIHPMSIRPGTYWLPYGKGKITVCVNDETEEIGDLKKFLTREGNIEYPSEYGSYWHTMTIPEMKAHYHKYDWGWLGGSSHVLCGNNSHCCPTNVFTGQTTVNTESTGGGKPFNIFQPSITVFRWQRVSLWDYNNDRAYMLNPFHVKLEEYNIYGNIWSAPLPDGTLPPAQVSQDGNPFF